MVINCFSPMPEPLFAHRARLYALWVLLLEVDFCGAALLRNHCWNYTEVEAACSHKALTYTSNIFCRGFLRSMCLLPEQINIVTLCQAAFCTFCFARSSAGASPSLNSRIARRRCLIFLLLGFLAVWLPLLLFLLASRRRRAGRRIAR